MFINELTIQINSQANKDLLVDEFNYFVSTLYKNGQIEVQAFDCFISDNRLLSFVTTLDKNALAKKYRNNYTNKQLSKVEKLCNSKFQNKIIGTSIENFKRACKCKNHNFFIFYTHLFDKSSPIICGTCFKAIPLYKLNLDEILLNQILNWKEDYKSCDTLQLQSRVGEQWATKQLTAHNSLLSKQGLDLCSKIKVATGVSTYYYLFNYRRIKLEKDKERNCPSCNSFWYLEMQLNKFYDFKCNKCGLISSLTTNGF